MFPVKMIKHSNQVYSLKTLDIVEFDFTATSSYWKDATDCWEVKKQTMLCLGQ